LNCFTFKSKNKNMLKPRFVFPLALVVSVLCCNHSSKDTKELINPSKEDNSFPALTEASAELPLNSLKLPKGFSISVFAEVEDARSLAISPSGTLFVGNRSEDKVYAVKDTDGDGKADKKWVIASGLNMPNGVAFRNGDLYVAEVNRIHKFSGIESKLADPGASTIVYDKFPTEKHHGWKYIAFGPDGKLYVPVGAPCNICESKDHLIRVVAAVRVQCRCAQTAGCFLHSLLHLGTPLLELNAMSPLRNTRDRDRDSARSNLWKAPCFEVSC
jgi:glucose/arabinose dehydrogenase